ncbi:MAG TPA: response regulator [Longimicrobium sp.]
MSAKYVLLVDSHEDSRAIYTTILEHYGFAVATAAHPDEGLRMARARRPDLIVLEFSPPRARSLEAFRAFRADPATASVPMVALSTTLGEADRELLVSEGIAGYLVKPCPPLTLLDVARGLLESS